MKFMPRFVVLCCSLLAFGMTFFGATAPVAAGCTNEILLNSATAFRDHISITFTINKAGVSPVLFTVTDNKTQVGSTTFSSASLGTFTVDFDLDASIVQELDSLDVEADPSLGCEQFATVTASGFFGSTNAPQCPDGRINYNHCDKIAIYPVKDEGSFAIEVWIVDHKVLPEFALFVSSADLKALDQKPEKIVTIATSSNGLVTLYKHPNGDYQVNYGPDFEGKVFTFRFSGLPAATYPEVTTFMVGALLPRYTPEIG